MKILRSLPASLAPVVVIACSLTQSTSSLTDGVCSGSLKACNQQCVPLGKPENGCGPGTCTPCMLANATATCSSNACAVASCNADHKDCNNSPTDGCEVDTTNDANNCGACGMKCPSGHQCVSSSCLLVSQIASSSTSNHTCAVLTDGTVRCWGANDSGQVSGQACSQAPCNQPNAAPVSGVQGAVQVATGQTHTCVLLKDGTVSCWGANESGQLGLGQPDMTVHAPTAVPMFTNVKTIGAGPGFTCAVKNDGSLWCWGANSFGQLALGNQNAQSSPTQVGAVGGGLPAVNNAVAVAAGLRAMYALTQSGNVSAAYAAGYDETSQLGVGGTTVVTASPTCASTSTSTQCDCMNVPDICSPALLHVPITPDNAFIVTAGNGHMCILRSADGLSPYGTIWCAGDDTYGQLGDNQTAPMKQAVSPVQTITGGATSTTFAAVSAGAQFTCAILKGSGSTSGFVACWGLNEKGELFVDTTTAQQLNVATVNNNVTADALTTGSQHTCVLQNHNVSCVGANDRGQLGTGASDMMAHSAPLMVQGLP